MRINNTVNINSVADSLKSKTPKIIVTLLMLCAMCSFGVFAQELTEEVMRSAGERSTKDFLKQIGDAKAYVPKKWEYKKQTYTTYRNPADPDCNAKFAAAHKAVKILTEEGVKIPENLRIYCTNNPSSQNISFQRDAEWNPVANIVLGYAALKRNYPMGTISESKFRGLEMPTIITIHEIGHILHERTAGNVFWSPDFKGSSSTGSKVSAYAGGNKKEFVAEVFAGVIIGMQFPQDVLEEYQEYGGPKIPSLRYFIGRDW
jgi:hypothetical protein